MSPHWNKSLLALSAALTLWGCGNKAGNDSATSGGAEGGVDDGETEGNGGSDDGGGTGSDSGTDDDGGTGSDSGTGDDGGGTVDADGDGYAADEDCDDTDGAVWLADSPTGTLDFDAFCPGYCGRTFQGDLDLSSTSQTQIEQLSCLVWVIGNLVVVGNASVPGLDLGSLETVGQSRRVQ